MWKSQSCLKTLKYLNLQDNYRSTELSPYHDLFPPTTPPFDISKYGSSRMKTAIVAGLGLLGGVGVERQEISKISRLEDYYGDYYLPPPTWSPKYIITEYKEEPPSPEPLPPLGDEVGPPPLPPKKYKQKTKILSPEHLEARKMVPKLKNSMLNIEKLTTISFLNAVLPVIEKIKGFKENRLLMLNEIGIRKQDMNVKIYDTWDEIKNRPDIKNLGEGSFLHFMASAVLHATGGFIDQTIMVKFPDDVSEVVSLIKQKMKMGIGADAAKESSILDVLYRKGGIKSEDYFLSLIPSEHVHNGLDTLFAFIEDNLDEAKTDKDFAAKLATVGEIILKYIHPFHDGNGRCGRALGLVVVERSGHKLTRIDRK